MWRGNRNQAFHATIGIEMSNKISGVEPSHAVANQGKSLLVAAEEILRECLSPFRDGASARYFRYERHDSHGKQDFLYTTKVFDRSEVRKPKKPVQQDKAGGSRESHFYDISMEIIPADIRRAVLIHAVLHGPVLASL